MKTAYSCIFNVSVLICIDKNPQCTSLNRAFSCDVIANRLEGKNNTFSLLWEVRSIFMQNCFIVSALQHGRREKPLYHRTPSFVSCSFTAQKVENKSCFLLPYSFKSIFRPCWTIVLNLIIPFDVLSDI